VAVTPASVPLDEDTPSSPELLESLELPEEEFSEEDIYAFSEDLNAFSEDLNAFSEDLIAFNISSPKRKRAVSGGGDATEARLNTTATPSAQALLRSDHPPQSLAQSAGAAVTGEIENAAPAAVATVMELMNLNDKLDCVTGGSDLQAIPFRQISPLEKAWKRGGVLADPTRTDAGEIENAAPAAVAAVTGGADLQAIPFPQVSLAWNWAGVWADPTRTDAGEIENATPQSLAQSAGAAVTGEIENAAPAAVAAVTELVNLNDELECVTGGADLQAIPFPQVSLLADPTRTDAGEIENANTLKKPLTHAAPRPVMFAPAAVAAVAEEDELISRYVHISEENGPPSRGQIMERKKVGERFKINGKWYQVKAGLFKTSVGFSLKVFFQPLPLNTNPA